MFGQVMGRGARGRPSPWPRAGFFVVLVFVFSWVPLGASLILQHLDKESPLPAVLWAISGLGPMLAAGISAVCHDSGPGLKWLIAGMRRWRVGRWYFLLLVPLPVAATGVCATMMATGAHPVDLAGWQVLPLLFVSGVVFGGLEEIGWRGYLLPVLQQRWTALAASMAVGVLWALWHAPLFFLPNTTQAATSPVWFTLQALGLSIVLGWAFNSTCGGTLLVVLVHGAVNGWYGTAAQSFTPERLADFSMYTALVTLAAASGLIWAFGPEHLSRRQRHRWGVDPGAETG